MLSREWAPNWKAGAAAAAAAALAHVSPRVVSELPQVISILISVTYGTSSGGGAKLCFHDVVIHPVPLAHRGVSRSEDRAFGTYGLS